MNITIKVIPNSEMRQGVDGADWYFTEQGDLEVRVAPLSDWRYEVLLGLHEAYEAVLCRHDGVTVQQVDEFDQDYDKNHAADLNAGDEHNAPYRTQHCLATAAERIMAGHMGICWKDYDDELSARYPGPSKRQDEKH
jgi:hypothetical protein